MPKTKSNIEPVPDFFTDLTKAFPFPPEWSRRNLTKARSAFHLWPELFGIETALERRFVSVPYLNAFVEFSIGQDDEFELGSARRFAATEQASTAMHDTIGPYREALAAQTSHEPEGLLTLKQLGACLCMSRGPLRNLVKHSKIPTQVPVDREKQGWEASALTIYPEHVSRLFEWHYPASYPGEPLHDSIGSQSGIA